MRSGCHESSNDANVRRWTSIKGVGEGIDSIKTKRGGFLVRKGGMVATIPCKMGGC